jgi:hypothetical protein
MLGEEEKMSGASYTSDYPHWMMRISPLGHCHVEVCEETYAEVVPVFRMR